MYADGEHLYAVSIQVYADCEQNLGLMLVGKEEAERVDLRIVDLCRITKALHAKRVYKRLCISMEGIVCSCEISALWLTSYLD